MNPNPGERLKHAHWQRRCSVDERRPIRIDIAYVQRIEEAEEAKKKKAEIAKSKGTRRWIQRACLMALAIVPGILYIQSGVKRWQLSPTEKQLAGIAALYRGYGAALGKPPASMQALILGRKAR
jgi:hypothetical protein